MIAKIATLIAMVMLAVSSFIPETTENAMRCGMIATLLLLVEAGRSRDER